MTSHFWWCHFTFSRVNVIWGKSNLRQISFAALWPQVCSVKITFESPTNNLIRRTPPPGGVSLFQNQKPGGSGHPWRTTPKTDQFWGWFFRPLPPSSWFRNHPIKPGGGGWSLSKKKIRIVLFFLSFFLGFRRPNLITGLSGWGTPD